MLKKEKNAKYLLPGLKIHRLSRRKEVPQMLNKLNPGSSINEIGLQNKSWGCMVALSMRISNHIRKGIPVYAAIDNNDGVKETLTGKDTTYDTNMTLFQPIYKDLFGSLLENLIKLSLFNVFEMCIKKTLYSITIFRFCHLFSAYNLFTEALLMFESKSVEVW